MSDKKRLHFGVLFSTLDNTCQYDIWTGIVDYAQKNNIRLSAYFGTYQTANYDIATHFETCIETIVGSKTLDGVIIFSGFIASIVSAEDLEIYTARIAKRYPIVSVSYTMPGVPSILIDNETGVFSSVEHLIKVHGKKHIAYVKGPDGHPEAEARLEGYRKALEANSIEYDERYVFPGTFSNESGYLAVRSLLATPDIKADAIVTCDDSTAIGVLNELKAKNYVVPRDIAVVGFDDDRDSKTFVPAISTVRQDFNEIGRISAKTLQNRINNKPVKQEIYITPKFVARESCGCMEEETTDVLLKYKDVLIKEFASNDEMLMLRRVVSSIAVMFDVVSLSNELLNTLPELLIDFTIIGLYTHPIKSNDPNADRSIGFLTGFVEDEILIEKNTTGTSISFSNYLTITGIDFDKIRYNLFFFPLFIKDEEYGVMLMPFNPGVSINNYESLRVNIANAIKGVYMIDELEKRDNLLKAANRQLETLVEERTNELAIETTTLFTLLNSIPDIIYTKNSDLYYTHCNSAMLKHYGKEMEEIIGKNDSDLGLSYKQVLKENMNDINAMHGNKPVVVEEKLTNADGIEVILETTKVPLRIDDKVLGVVGISRDITKVKENERKVAYNYEYTKRLSNALVLITKSSKILEGDVKAAAEFIAQEGSKVLNVHRISIWGITNEEDALVNITTYERATDEYKIFDNFDLVSREDYSRLLQSERLLVAKNVTESEELDDGYNPVLCARLEAPIRVDGKLAGLINADLDICNEFPEERDWLVEEQNFVSSLADLMALTISGFERRKARESAELANQAKSAFIANVSHEIRTPMNSILGITEIMAQSETLSTDSKENLRRIYNSSVLLLGIINDILDFSKIEVGKLDIIPNQYETASLINDSVQLNIIKIGSKPIEFLLLIDENIPAKLIGDELRIKQILNNLLSNAFKYTNNGRITVSFSSEKGKNKKTTMLVLKVEDTGYGMSKEQLDKLFDEYSRFEQKGKYIVEGTGLGLAITKRLLDMMDGSISVESEPDVGSVFTVKLPQEIVDKEIIGKEIAESLKGFSYFDEIKGERRKVIRDVMPYGTVLIVDDVETNRYVAAGLMKLFKLKIEVAESGFEAIEKIESGKVYDIVFMDHMMPLMDGMETTKKLRKFGYESPIVALTANAVLGQADIFLQNGFDDFLSKPIDIRRLTLVLNKYVRNKQPADVIEIARRLHETGVNAQEADFVDGIIDEKASEQEKPDVRIGNIKIPGLDITKGIERYDGNESVYLTVLRSYAISVRSMLSKIENNGYKDLLEYRTNVHGIKGASFDILANEVGKKAGFLEDAARNDDLNYIEKNNAKFLKLAWKLINELEGAFTAINEANPKPKKSKIDKELLKRLCAACEDYDMNLVDDTMEEIDEYQYEEDQELAERLRENVDKMNYSKITAELSDI
ncbi:MAG: substrate-binding domain-containing protein [Oscillospiraceae bacterium]|jgi:PAS domain S-box-containing protein|nr:substrate-binding domain-containing protein [Oscillospiraceae bacterium]